ncbi:M14 family zinc carboxypeptidase [Bacillus sp. JJ1532]|uniref:M14 family zinc carboxypeptidase n=1 Tax=unclassified Bacillus (in: firmicutes) TaxID=185979 RepID=UPI002FFE9D67
MPIRKLSFLFVALVLLITQFPLGSNAQNGNADCSNLTDPSVNGWVNYEQMVKRLHQIEQTSFGRVELDVIGQSRLGKDIYAARVGTGDRVMLVTSEIHGNEKTGTEALLQMLKELGSGNNPEIQAIRNNVTIVAVPKFNPDGAELNQRQNVFPWEEVVNTFPQLKDAKQAWYYTASRGGFDVNRDFNPDLNYEPRAEDMTKDGSQPGFFLTNESRVLRNLYVNLKKEFGEVEAYVDLHHMGACNKNEGSDQYVTVSLDYPPLGPENNSKYQQYTQLDQEKSRRYALAAALGMEDHAGNGNAETSPFWGGASRYFHPSDRDLPGQARSSFALNGTATVLFEVRGQQHNWGQKQKGMLTKAVKNGLYGIANGMADGSVDRLNGNDFYNLPKYW